MEGDGGLRKVIGRGGPAVGAGGVVHYHYRPLNLPPRAPRLTSALTPPGHVVTVCMSLAPVLASSSTPLALPSYSAMATVLPPLSLVPLLLGREGGVLTGGVALLDPLVPPPTAPTTAG